MRFALILPDGRELCDHANQIIVTNAAGTALLLAYITNNVIVCGHHRESSWSEFLLDAGYSSLERLPTQSGGNKLVCRVQLPDGRVLALCSRAVRVYSDNGDPVAAAVWNVENQVTECRHCADDDWSAYCSKHNIFKPRELTIVEA